MAYVDRGYWIDIGTPEKYTQVHRDIMDGRYRSALFADDAGAPWVSPDARVDAGATLEGPCFIDEGAVVKTGARIAPYSVIGRQCHVEEHAVIDGSILWPYTQRLPGGGRSTLHPRPAVPCRQERRSSTMASCSATSRW